MRQENGRSCFNCTGLDLAAVMTPSLFTLAFIQISLLLLGYAEMEDAALPGRYHQVMKEETKENTTRSSFGTV